MKKFLFSKESLCVIFSCLFMLGHVALSAQLYVLPGSKKGGGDGGVACYYAGIKTLEIPFLNGTCGYYSGVATYNECANIKVTNISFHDGYQPTSASSNNFSPIPYNYGSNSRTFNYNFSNADWANILQNNLTGTNIDINFTITYRYQLSGVGKQILWSQPVYELIRGKWAFCGGNLPYSNNPHQGGSQTVFYKEGNSLDEASLTSLDIKPNPVSDFVNISYKAKEAATLDIILYDMTGRIVKNITIQEKQDGTQNTKTVDLSALDAGTYFLVLKSGEDIKTEKIIKL